MVGWDILQLNGSSRSLAGGLVCLSGDPTGISCESIFLRQVRGVW